MGALVNTSDALDFFNDLYTTIWQECKLSKFSDFYHPDVRMQMNSSEMGYKEVLAKVEKQASLSCKLEYEIISLISMMIRWVLM